MPASIRKECVICGTAILAKSTKAKYCSKSCTSKAHRLKVRVKGATVYFTTEIFDSWFREAA